MESVSVQEQVERLAAVDLTKQDLRKARRKRVRPTMIPLVDRRLRAWGEWVLSEGRSDGMVCGRSPLHSIIENMGESIRGTNPAAGSMPDDIYDVDRIVMGLEEGERQVVSLQYLELSLSMAERAERVCVKTRAFNERVAKVHQKIFVQLKPSKCACVGEYG